jgi:hypothetical protein
MALLLTGFTFQQCSDDDQGNDLTEQDEVSVTKDSNDADNAVEEDVQYFYTVDAAAHGNNGGRVQGQCVVVTNDTAAKTVTLDFGDGCVGPHGRVRSGKVIITYGGTFGDSLANRVITFSNYVVSNKKISGTIELRDFNLNAEGHLTSTRKMINVKIEYPNGQTTTLNGVTTREWIEGQGDGNIENDVIKLTGYFEGTSTSGRSFKHNIVQPIISSFSCRSQGGFLRVSGVTEETISNGRRTRIRTVNYGDGTCDNIINVTINSKAISITLDN